MIHSTRTLCAILILSATALAPRGAHAQNQPKVGGVVSIESLSSQERDMLSLANDLATRASVRMERWIADKETTEEKLFSFFYYPIPKTDPSKFNTDWDQLSDRDLLAIEEAVLVKSATILYAIVCDKNGYVPTHNQRYSLPLTGNPASDLLNNRTKRLFQDRTGFAAARNEAPFLIQRYQRDTGEVLAEVSVPLYVNDKHWGAIRLGYRPIEGR
jgi:methyl-accepting chemotaxis protein